MDVTHFLKPSASRPPEIRSTIKGESQKAIAAY